jgi:hypothetical protein
MKMTTNLHLVPKSRIVELYLHSPMSSWQYLINDRDNFTFYKIMYIMCYVLPEI